jgi:thioredoxin-related protein
MESYVIGGHGQASVKHPDWFKDTFFDLREDLEEARDSGKRVVIVFLTQEHCNHCQAFLDTTLKDTEIRNRLNKSYDVLGLDIFSDIELTDIDGTTLTVNEYTLSKKARFTPTLLFYGTENIILLKIVGFYPPEKFRSVLDFIDGGYYKTETLSEYLRRQINIVSSQESIAYDQTLFSKPPHDLNRSNQKSEQPVLVIFEIPNCNPCKRFHQRVLGDTEVRNLLTKFDAIQLDATDTEILVTTPNGDNVTPMQWADVLQLGYDISSVFFDKDGNEVHRIDSETGVDRFTGSLQYVLEGAYQQHDQFQHWRRENALKANDSN